MSYRYRISMTQDEQEFLFANLGPTNLVPAGLALPAFVNAPLVLVTEEFGETKVSLLETPTNAGFKLLAGSVGPPPSVASPIPVLIEIISQDDVSSDIGGSGYNTLSDLKKSMSESDIIQLTDDDQSGGIDETVVDEGIAWAFDLINNHVRGKYPVPLSPVPDMVEKISVDLVIYFLYTRRQAYEIPDGVAERYKMAIKLLEKIQGGKIVLEVDIGTTDTSELRTNKTADDRIFPKDVLDKY